MKKLKYFTILMLVGLLTLTGCSVGKKLSPEERLEKALNNLASAESLTAKTKLRVEGDGNKLNFNMNVKAAKNKKGYDLYIGADVMANIEDEKQDYSLEGYLFTSKKAFDLYFMIEDYQDDWAHLKIDVDELEDMGLKIDSLVFETDIDVDMDTFKKIKEGKTEDGITEIIATVDADEIDGFGEYKLEDDLKVSFFIDKDNNLIRIEVDLVDIINSDEVDKAKLTVDISKINETKVKVPSDVEDDAEEIDLEELITELFGTYNNQSVTPSVKPSNTDDYSAEDIFDDIILSSKIKTCSNGDFEVDFKNYKDELFLYDDEYDIKRVSAGVIKFTKNGDKCDFEITTPIVIDGKTCSRVNEYDSECK